MAEFNAALRDKLLTLGDNDINAIEFANSYSKTNANFNSKEFVEHVEDTNTAQFKAVLEEIREWPGESTVGKEGAIAAFIIAQHSDRDLKFQKHALTMLEQAVQKKDMHPGAVAFLTDRVLVNEGKKQRFGTQFQRGLDGKLESKPLEDASLVNARRATMGLNEPVETYIARMDEGDKVPFRELLETGAAMTAETKHSSWAKFVKTQAKDAMRGLLS